MGKVKEQIIDVDVRCLIYEVPDGLERIPINEIPECVAFIERNLIGYLNYLDRFFDCEETNQIYEQEEWKKDWFYYLLNNRQGNLEVQCLIEILSRYVVQHYDELMNQQKGR